MTLDEIGKRLKAEFPGRMTTFVAQILVFDNFDGDIRCKIMMGGGIFDDVTVSTLDEGILLLKEQLKRRDASTSSGDFDVTLGTKREKQEAAS